MELVSNVRRWGNSAGVLLPREWLGNQVKIIVVERAEDLKEETLNILKPYLEDIFGVYLTGSYARNEQTSDSDIDIIAISKSVRKEISEGKYHISIIPLENIKKTLKLSPILVLPRLIEAKPILNSYLLNELVNLKVNKASFKSFKEECKRIIKINLGLINLDKEDSEFLESRGVVYSAILRLRGIFIMRCILSSKKYSNMEFLRYLYKHSDKSEMLEAYECYKAIKEGKKFYGKIKIKTAQKLVELLNEEVKNAK